jgi:hypothetical protein
VKSWAVFQRQFFQRPACLSLRHIEWLGCGKVARHARAGEGGWGTDFSTLCNINMIWAWTPTPFHFNSPNP